jgi:glycosyltransferase involved in cell wall biosynthesis
LEKLIVQSENPEDNALTSLVSIIIPTRNSARTISRCLDSIKNQTYENIEIFVIDSFSSDNTSKLASMFNVKIFLLDGERAKAKNFGISNAAGQFLLFVDSDMVLQPCLVEECVNMCSANRKIVAVTIPERSIGPGFWVKVRDFERDLYKGSNVESPRFFVKEFVSLVGGFDENIVAYEESTLQQKLEAIGMNVNARATSLIHHDEEGFNLRKWLVKKRYSGKTGKLYAKKYRKYAKMQFSLSNRTHIFLANGNWKRLVRHPILSTGVFILKTLEYLAFFL